jgi:AAT family amino acid transporter/D-serine/D-alanine/glycine transporter
VSPFVFVFGKLGLPGAASIINLVVITAAASSCNSGLFSTGRMLWTLAQSNQAPRAFASLSNSRVPAAGIHASAAVMLIGVVLNYLVPERVFTIVTSVALVGTLWTWGIILVAHANYRRAVAQGRVAPAPFRMPGAPLANWIVLAFLVLVSVMLARDPDTRVALYVAPVWFALLIGSYLWMKRGSVPAPQS